MIRKARKMEDLIDYQSLSLFPDVRLPPKFKMPTLDKFDGTSYPKSHLKMYMRAMQPLGAAEELLAQMFQNTLMEPLLSGSSTWKILKQRVGRTSAVSCISNTSTT